MTTRKRITIRCWNTAGGCGHDYTWLATLDTSLELLIACPYCGAEAVVRLAPYALTTHETLAGEPSALTFADLALPEVLGSEPRTDGG